MTANVKMETTYEIEEVKNFKCSNEYRNQALLVKNIRKEVPNICNKKLYVNCFSKKWGQIWSGLTVTNFQFLLGILLIGPARTQPCWRDTPCSNITTAAFPGVWDSNIFAPSSRTVSPKFILSLSTGQRISSYPGASALTGNGSSFVFDFGIEVGGILIIQYTASGSGSGSVGMAFTEAKNFIGFNSDSSTSKQDGALYSNFTGPGAYNYTMPDPSLRGGFRYLTIFLNSAGASVNLTNISLEIGFQPTWSNLRAYQGYFHSNDEMLNAIWYSGAYTIQLCSVPVHFGRAKAWDNNGTLGPGNTIIVDGAKRDRTVWPGDMGVAVPSSFVSIGDMESVKNGLQVMYNDQDGAGLLPYSGPPMNNRGSDTYHLWTMIGTYNYVLYTNDTAFLALNWDKYLKAMTYIYNKVQTPSGLLYVTDDKDWARKWSGGNMSEAQMILYRTLITGAQLANWVGDTTGLSAKWTSQAANLRTATLTNCYDAAYGAFKNNATNAAMYPQDANSLAILHGVVDANSSQAQNVSAQLTKNWTPYGPEPPEYPGNVSPFASSFEVQAHFVAGQTQRALDLLRRCWGWYLNHPSGSQSSVIEGFLSDGKFGYTWYGAIASEYLSHAHGWASGPTSALTNFVVGLSVTGPIGITWRFAPQFGDLLRAEAGFLTPLGKYQGRWAKEKDGSYNATCSTPPGTSGDMILPVVVKDTMPRIMLDGVLVRPNWYMRNEFVSDTVVIHTVGGDHTIIVI